MFGFGCLFKEDGLCSSRSSVVFFSVISRGWVDAGSGVRSRFCLCRMCLFVEVKFSDFVRFLVEVVSRAGSFVRCFSLEVGFCC